MIVGIRAFVDNAVKSVDSTLNSFDEDLFGNNDITTTQAVNSYNLIFGTLQHGSDGNGFNQVMPCTLDIYAKSVRDVALSFDSLYEKAICISHYLVDPVEIGLADFNSLEFETIEPLEEQTNDNAIKMRLSFTVRKDFFQ